MEPDEIVNILLKTPYNFTDEDIPDPTITCMLEDDKLYSYTDYTPAMLYIHIWKCDVPLSLRHDPAIQNQSRRMTCAMFWIENCKSEPPEWMRHDPNIQNVNGMTYATLWSLWVGTEVPEYLRMTNIL